MKKTAISLMAVAALGSCTTLDNYIDTRVEQAIEEYQQEQQHTLLYHTTGILENALLLESDVKIGIEGSPHIRQGEMRGVGYIVSHNKNDYIITVAHNVTAPRIFTENGLLPIETKSTTTSAQGMELESIVIDEERDIAVFAVPEKMELPEYRPSLGDSSSLNIFDNVYLIGNPGGTGVNIREGIISNQEKTRFLGPQGFESEGINVSISVYPGDSGNPLINEEGEIIGLAKERHYGGVTGYMSPIDWFKEHMD